MRVKYQNIDCNLYDLYVLHAMRKTKFYLDGSEEEISIIDLETKKKEEFAQLSNGMRIRLDKLKIKGKNLIIE